jgi:Helicase associated domain
MFANRAPFPSTSVGGLEVVDEQHVNLAPIEDLPMTIFEQLQSVDDVSLSDLWPRPILSRGCVAQGSYDTGRHPNSGTSSTCWYPSVNYIEPNQERLGRASKEFPTTFQSLRQQIQLGHSCLKAESNNFQQPYDSPRVSVDAEASLRDLIASWETVSGSHFTRTSTTSLKAKMTTTTQSQIVHAGMYVAQLCRPTVLGTTRVPRHTPATGSNVCGAACRPSTAIQALSHPVPYHHKSTKGDPLPSSLVGHLCFEDNSENKTFHEHHAQQWDETFDELLQYQEKYGNCQVPHGFSESPTLARWVKRQRYQYKLMKCGKPSTMNDERAARLNAIGFIWDSHSSVWDERICQIRKFVEHYGHAPIPKMCKRDMKLSNWIKQQRRQYTLFCQGRPSTITLERIEQLQNLGFEWCHRRRAS